MANPWAGEVTVTLNGEAHVARLTALLVTDELSKPVENVPPGKVPRRPGP